MIYIRLQHGQAGTLSLQMIYIRLQHGQARTLSLQICIRNQSEERADKEREPGQHDNVPNRHRAVDHFVGTGIRFGLAGC